MGEKKYYQVVVKVGQGKNFERRPRHSLILEARFEGTLLATDPVPYNETPDVSQELGWELDDRTLRQHRQQGTPVKVQIYSQNDASSARETIGYIVLHLKSAPNHPVMKSLPLLNAKYKDSRPEMELSLYIDDEKKMDKGAGDRANDPTVAADKVTTTVTAVESVDPKLLKPILIESDGYYQIGPVETGSDRFLLSTTIAFASNLIQLVPTNVALPSTGYSFYYSLLGNDIITETFYDLLNPGFVEERASVRLSGNLEYIRQFFANQPGLQLHLVCGNHTLGSCEIPLKNLLQKNSTEIYMRPVAVEGAYPLTPPKSSKLSAAKVLSENLRPVLGASVVLRLDPAIGKTPPTKDIPPHPVAQLNIIPISNGTSRGVPAERPAVTSPVSLHDGSYTETVESNSRSNENSDNAQIPRDTKTRNERKKVGPSGSPELDSRATGDNEVSSDTQRHLAVPPVPHHFRVSIDLKSISNLKVTNPINVFVKYSYSFFGSSSPIVTEPAVEVRRGTEVTFPGSYCTFDFATTSFQLQETFTRVPLKVEVWQRDRQMSQNVCFGVVEVPLDDVIKSTKSKTVHPSGTSGCKQTSSGWFPILSTEGERHHLGDLQVMVVLEDWGSIVSQTVIVNDADAQAERLQPSFRRSSSPQLHTPVSPHGIINPRETLEYKVALELEMWKEQQQKLFEEQQKLFEEQLRVKEKQLLKELEEEYKRRDKERVLLISKQKKEFDDGSEKLRKTLTELEKREKVIYDEEQKLKKYKKELEDENRRRNTELMDKSRRLEEELQHKLTLEKSRTEDCKETILKLKQRLTEEERKYQRLTLDFEAYKGKLNSEPEVVLQAKITQLMAEKVELENQLEASKIAKLKYKKNWLKTFESLAKLKENDFRKVVASEKQSRLQLKHYEIHHQFQKKTQADSQELDQIKKELQEMGRSHAISSQSVNQLSNNQLGQFNNSQVGQANQSNSSRVNLETEEEDEQITRLKAERDLLLKTGTYTRSDGIICDLERKILEAVARNQREKLGHLSSERTGHTSIF